MTTQQEDYGFDFDSASNDAPKTKTAAAKIINKPTGIWIAHDNQELVGWEESRWLEVGVYHEVETRKVINDEGDFQKIPGTLLRQPRMLIVGRSPLLAETSVYPQKLIGVWSNENKENGDRAVRIYMVVFLDNNNQPFHLAPIQLKSRGNFGYSFEQALVLGGKNLTENKQPYRTVCEDIYAQVTGKRNERKNERWHSCWIFAPKFKTEMRGKDPQTQSPACITIGYHQPTIENWEQFCIGRSPLAKDIALLYDSHVDFWKAKLPNTQNNQQQNYSDEEIKEAQDSLGWQVAESVRVQPKPLFKAQPQPQQDDDVFDSEERDESEYAKLIAESNEHLKRLKWTNQQGREYLAETYGKRSRQLLTDSELQDFVTYLKLQPDNTTAQSQKVSVSEEE